MDVNDVGGISNNLTSLNDVSTNSPLIGKSSNTSSIVNNEKDALHLTISQYNQKRDELSASLQTFTQGIGITTVAQNGLDNQIEFLKKIETKLTDIRDNNEAADDKNSYKNEINKELINFREEAFQTKYGYEKLIALDEYEENPTIMIDTKEAKYSLDKPNTPDIATNIAQKISNSDLNNPDSLLDVIDNVTTNIKKLDQIKEEFGDLQIKLKDNAKESIQEQITLSNEQRKNKDLNFGKESNDFSKTNVMANMGYLAASQANIVQEQSVRLLS